MSIDDRKYRTCTYIAGDWTGDKDAIEQIMTWNEGNKWGLHFTDVHKLTQSYDESYNCSIKASLRKRMTISKRFVLIVGDNTKTLRSGACCLCPNYIIRKYTNTASCTHGGSIDNRSYVDYECGMAKLDYDNGAIEIVVLYNSVNVDKSKCPETLRSIGRHLAMRHWTENCFGYRHTDWDYTAVKRVLD